jgi:transcriptional regulator with XRE-family HTH domain
MPERSEYGGPRAGQTLARPGFRHAGDARTVLVVRLGRLGPRPKRPPKEMAPLMDASRRNEALRVAIAARGLEMEAVARAVGVDPKTVGRWLGGRVPHPRHRWKLCDLLGQSEQHLWPGVGLGASGANHTSEIVAAFAHRADAPSQLWAGMLERVRTNLDLLGYAMLFFPEQHPQLARLIEAKCAQGLRVRIALADPDGDEVQARDQLEGLGGTLPGRIRSTAQHLEPLLASPGVELRFHGVPLYNAIYRFDDEMLVTPYLYKLHGYQHPLLHLKRLGAGGIFEGYAGQFEAIWAESHPAAVPTGG